MRPTEICIFFCSKKMLKRKSAEWPFQVAWWRKYARNTLKKLSMIMLDLSVLSAVKLSLPVFQAAAVVPTAASNPLPALPPVNWYSKPHLAPWLGNHLPHHLSVLPAQCSHFNHQFLTLAGPSRHLTLYPQHHKQKQGNQQNLTVGLRLRMTKDKKD